MRKTRFTEQQIKAILKAAENGQRVKDICQDAGISEATYYNWKIKYSALISEDIHPDIEFNPRLGAKIKALEEENQKLKQMLGDLYLEKCALKEALEKYQYN